MTRSSLPPDSKAHQLVHFLYRRLVAEDMTRAELEIKAGLGDKTVSRWCHADHAITLQNMEAALGALGYGLRVVPLPAHPEKAPIALGNGYMTKGGASARVTSIENGIITGAIFNGHVPVQWDLAGRRLPATGNDPADLVLK